MNKEKMWKIIAIVSMSLLVIVIGTSSSIHVGSATLADVCNDLESIATALNNINSTIRFM
jgi:hypothetical protein